MLFVPYGRPGLSGGNPETLVGATTLHVGGGGCCLVTGCPVGACVACMSTPAMGPAVGTWRGRSSLTATTAGAIDVASCSTATVVTRVVALIVGVGGSASTHECHHFGHLG
jgi:hypothetical protein